MRSAIPLPEYLATRSKVRSAIGLIAFSTVVLSSAICARAATVNWIAPTPDIYTNKAAWSTGNLPAAADTAVVGNATVATGTVSYTNAAPDPASTNTIASLLLGNTASSTGNFTQNAGALQLTGLLAAGAAASGNGNFTLNGGTLSVTNAGANIFLQGNANLATGNFVMNGGTLNLLRNTSTFFQDYFEPGFAAGSTGVFTLNSGTVNAFCGIEIGVNGIGTINVNGGVLIDNGWFGVGRGGSGTTGWGNFNLSNGIVYLLRNPGTEGGGFNGVSFCQGGTNGTVNISGGTLYAPCFRFKAGPGTGKTDWENWTVSGGDIYLSGSGVVDQNGAGTHNLTVNISGGNFRTVNLLPNNATGTLSTNAIGTGGTNWAWAATIPATLTNSPGPGTASFFPDAGRTITLNNVFSGPGGITMSGLGTLAVNGVNQYTGPTALNSGTVSGTGTIQGAVTTSPGVTIAPGTTLAAGTLSLGTSLTLNTATNIIKLSSDPTQIGNNANDLIVVGGNLVLQGVTVIKIVPLGPLSSASPYTVIQYSGTPLSSSDAAHFSVVSANPRYSFTVVDPSTTYPYIQISVTGNAANLIWKGAHTPTGGTWDHTSLNWFNTGTSASDTFFDGDATAFDDTAVSNVVSLAAAENPATINMTNNSLAYTFAGVGPLTGTLDLEGTNSVSLTMSNPPVFSTITANAGTLIYNLGTAASSYNVNATISDNGGGQGTFLKAGTNTMVLQGNNSSFYGTIVVTNGLLQYTNGSGLGVTASPLFATNGGSLDLNGVVIGPKNVQISGPGYANKGAVTCSSNVGLQNGNGINNLTMVGDASIGGVNRWDVYQNGMHGNGFTLTEVGPGANLFVDVGETALGNIHIVAGRLGFQGNVTMGDPTKTLTIESNATLTLFAATNSLSPDGGEQKIMVLNGYAIIDSGGASNNFDGAISVTGTNLIGTRSTLHLWGNISDVSGSGGFLLGNSPISPSGGDLYLDGNNNTYSGATIITNRTLFVGASSSLGSSHWVQVVSPGKLDVTSQATFTFGTGQTVGGNGIIAGNSVVFGSGSTLAPGLPGTNTSGLTISASLTLQAGSTNLVVVNKNGTVANNLVNGLTSVSIGGTLVISNVGSPLAGGDAIKLFSSLGSYSGSFSAIIPSTPGAGLTWDTSTLDTDGNLRVLSSGPPSNPTNMTFTVSANQLTIGWPSNYVGWTLQGQTNSTGVGITTGWFDVPGSASTNQVIIPINPNNGSVFYRMSLNP